MNKFFLKLILIIVVAIGTISCKDEEKKTDKLTSDIPAQNELVRLARQGLKDINARRVNVGFVEIYGEFPDGSKQIKVFTESGNYAIGRLFKDRARYRISINAEDFYSENETINININR